MGFTAERCTICTHKRVELIDAALLSGQRQKDVGSRFGFGEDHVQKHWTRHVKPKAPKPAEVARAMRPIGRVLAAVQSDEIPLTAKRVRTPDAVLDEIEWILAKSKAMYEEAERSADWDLATKAMTQVQNAAEKLAKAASVYSDGTIVNVDASTKKLEVAIAGMTVDELRAALAGGSALPGESPKRLN